MASTTSGNPLPRGMAIFTTIPDIFFIPEFVFGGLVWTLVASTRVIPNNPLGWVMFVSIYCFIFTTLWFLIFISGKNKSSIWLTLDVAGHALAAFLYLSSSVVLAYITVEYAPGKLSSIIGQFLPGQVVPKVYQLDIAAVVMSFLATLFYTVHTVFSANRWKSP